jgi:ribose 5-phosphate isomerase B
LKQLFIASDHAGFALKEFLKKELSNDFSFIDLGCNSLDSVAYPNYAQKLCHVLINEKDDAALKEPCGILICGSGVGMSIAANRFKKIRAALVHTPELAVLSRAHNASNVLCLGSRFVSQDVAAKIIREWTKATFEGGRHQERIALMDL